MRDYLSQYAQSLKYVLSSCTSQSHLLECVLPARHSIAGTEHKTKSALRYWSCAHQHPSASGSQNQLLGTCQSECMGQGEDNAKYQSPYPGDQPFKALGWHHAFVVSPPKIHAN
eukprot:3764-Heterococcus_DN1.PRE.3